MDKMFESSSSQGVPLGKRPASSPAALEKRGKKRAAREEDELISLTVKGQEKEVHFKVKRKTKMIKILRMFCEKARVEYGTMRFYIDSKTFPVTSTPDEGLVVHKNIPENLKRTIVNIYVNMRFYIDSKTIPVTSTPDELHMNDGDEIEALGWQTGA